jgi:IS30 family transposase
MSKRTQQGALLSMDKFREILRLHEMGHSQCAIAQSCAVARSTVQDYIRRATAKGLSYEQIERLSDSDAKEQLGKGKRQVKKQTETIDFTTLEIKRQQKGVTLVLL